MTNDPIFYTPKGRKPIAESAHGIYIYDTDGKKYMDASSGAIVCQVGHTHPNIVATVQEQVSKLHFSYRTQFENQPAIDLANFIISKTTPELNRVYFVSGGSEAVESAMKLVRQFHYAQGDKTKSQFISRTPSYHGSTVGSLSLTSYQPLNRPFEPMVQEYPKVSSPTQYRVPANKTAQEHAIDCANEIEQAILEVGSENIAGFIAEPIGGASTGAEVPHDAYFARVQEICQQYNVLIILDEVLTGIGRTGKWFAYEHWNVDADVICLAKGLGAGYYPLGAIVAKDKIVAPVLKSGGFMHGFTYAGNPMACAVGLSVLNTIESENLVNNSAQQGSYLLESIEKLATNYTWIGDVRGKGLLMAIEFADKQTKKPFNNELKVSETITEVAYGLGLILYPRKSLNGISGDHVLISPPLNITIEESNELLNLLEQTFKSYDLIINQV